MAYNRRLKNAAVDHNLYVTDLLIINLSGLFVKAAFLDLSLATFYYLLSEWMKVFLSNIYHIPHGFWKVMFYCWVS